MFHVPILFVLGGSCGCCGVRTIVYLSLVLAYLMTSSANFLRLLLTIMGLLCLSWLATEERTFLCIHTRVGDRRA